MTRKCTLALIPLLLVTVSLLLFGTTPGRAGDRDYGRARGPISLLKTIPVPVSSANTTAGALYSFDISFVDPATQTYYLADRSNKAVDVVDAGTDTFITQIAPNNRHAPFAGFAPCVPPDGAEQPVWDPDTGKFYLSIPQIGSTPSHGGVVRISTTGVIEAVYPVELCSPAGLARGPRQDLLVGCNVVFDTAGGVWTGNADRNPNSAAPRYVIIDAKTGAA